MASRVTGWVTQNPACNSAICAQRGPRMALALPCQERREPTVLSQSQPPRPKTANQGARQCVLVTQIAPGAYTISEGPEILKETGTVTVEGDTVVLAYTDQTGQQVLVTDHATLRGT